MIGCQQATGAVELRLSRSQRMVYYDRILCNGFGLMYTVLASSMAVAGLADPSWINLSRGYELAQEVYAIFKKPR